MKYLRCILLVLAAVVCGSQDTSGQVAVKSNLLYDAFLNVNVGVEVKVERRWSVDIMFDYNNWTLSHGRRWRHWIVQPEGRLWLGEALEGVFFAGHLFGGQFNVMFGNRGRWQGPAVGFGAGFGWAWRLGSRWSLEAELALGYARYFYDKYECGSCGQKIAHRTRNYFGPTKAALSVVFLIDD